MSRETDWRTLCVKADPDFTRKSRITPEYRFSAPGRRTDPNSGKDGMASEDDIVEYAGERVFYADYQNRGPYGDD
jgi:hypothetical protein